MSCNHGSGLSCVYEAKNSDSIKAKIYYPCDWKLKINNNPGVIQYIANSSGTIALSFQVHSIEQGTLLSKELIRESIELYGKVISIKEAKLKGRNVIESIVETEFIDPNKGLAYSKILAFTFIDTTKGISLNFSSQSLDKNVADKQFSYYEKLWRQIAEQAIFN